MDYNRIINKYGWVSIDEIYQNYFTPYIHPHDLDKINSSKLTDSVFICISFDEDDYLKLKSSEITIRLKAEVFRPMPLQPKFAPLEHVKYLSSKGKIENGKVINISWHNKENKHIYYLEVDGKKKSKRYFEEDLRHS